MAIQCPACRNSVTGRDVNIEAAIARCPICQDVFSIHGLGVSSGLPASQLRPRVPKPDDVEFHRAGGELRIRWDWNSSWRFGSAFGAVVAFGLSALILGVGFTGLSTGHQGPALILMVVGLGLFCLGISAAYHTLAGFLNSTGIYVNQKALAVRDGPIHWGNDVDLQIAELDQLHCRTAHSGLRNDHLRYELIATLKDGSEVTVLTMQSDPRTVWFAEQQIESLLKIEDRRMVGEHLG